MLPHILANSFDEEFSVLAEGRLKSKGVNLILNTRLTEVYGKEKVEGVKFVNGQQIDVDGIILDVGCP